MRRVPWVALGLLAAALGCRLAAWLEPWAAWMPGCAFKRWSGLACATCGMTRCAFALGRGAWAEAWHWHPVAVALLGLALPLAVLDLARAWRGRPYPALPAGPWARAAVWGLLALAWILQAARGI